MLRVGLTGGLASGKSFVGKTLAQLGCHLIQADELGHKVLLPGGEAYASVIKEFGTQILAPDGAIDRHKLAMEVFDQPERLKSLNSLIHPPVIRMQEELMAQAEAADPEGIAVVEAAILIETGSYKRFKKLILAVCDDEQQIKRAIHRDHMTRDEALARLARQMPLTEKRKYADYVVDTSGTKEQTIIQTQQIYNSLRSLIQV
jgi:dephospho-CoA kinase